MTQQPDQQPAPEVDLDAWLDDIDLPVTDVTIYAKASLVNEHDRLVDEIRQQTLADVRVDEEDRGMDHGSRVADLEQQRADVVRRLQSSARTFHLHGLSQDQHAQIYDQAVDPATRHLDGEKHLRIALAAMCDELTPDAVDRLRARLPLSQWTKFADAVNRLLLGGVDVPFS